MLGVIYHQEGRLAEAEQMFNEALRINPAYTEAALNLVVTSNDLGKYAEAKTVYEKAMATSKRAPRELDPFAKGKIANMHADVGAAYRAVSLFDEAVREYEQALALCPTFVDIRTELGTTRREMGDLPGAIRELERVRAENPKFIAGRLKLGLVYYAAGAATTPPRSGARCWRRTPRTAPRRCTSRCSTRPPRATVIANGQLDRRRTCSPSRPRPRASSSRRSPPTRRREKARTPSCGSRSAA